MESELADYLQEIYTPDKQGLLSKARDSQPANL
jgi:hypothetical protein